MLTNADIKLIRSLAKARERQTLALFPAEGGKLISELLGYFPCRLLVANTSTLQEIDPVLRRLNPRYRPQRIEQVADNFDFTRISNLKQPQDLVALFELPDTNTSALLTPPSLAILLDQVQDPGNMGTIIRTADWFGVNQLYLTPGCADPFAPKVVQATMGALGRVRLTPLEDVEHFLTEFRVQTPEARILGTFLDGENLYRVSPSPTIPTLLVMGNEGNGISPLVERYVTDRITIPAYPIGVEHTESLNVAIATAICLSELRRVEM